MTSSHHELTDLPREHRITAKAVGDAELESIEDGSLNWNRDVGLQHYSCSCGESFEGSNLDEEITIHLLDVGVLD